MEWFRERDQWQYRDYEPSSDDLIFYDWESNGLADHVGVVECVEDGIVYSIEGNASDMYVEKNIYSVQPQFVVLSCPSIDSKKCVS